MVSDMNLPKNRSAFLKRPLFLGVSEKRHVILLRDMGGPHRKHHSGCILNDDNRKNFGGEVFLAEEKT